MEQHPGRTWEDLAVPILAWVANHEGASSIDTKVLAEELGVAKQLVDREAKRLRQAGYLDGGTNFGGTIVLPELTERGLRSVGVWPSENSFDDMLAFLDSRIAAGADPEERSRLTAVREAVASLGRDLGVNLLSTYIATRMGV